MPLFQSLLKTRSSQDTHHEVQISDGLRRLELESQSRRDGLANISDALNAYSTQIEKQYIPVTMALSKALIQQGKFYQERTEYSQLLVRLGEALAEKAERERHSTVVDLRKRLGDLAALGVDLERAQKDVEARRLALEDRKSKLAKKPKPELEEQVRGAEMLLKEATDKLEAMMGNYAQQEESLLLEPIGVFLSHLSSNDSIQIQKAPPQVPQRMPSERKQLPSPPPAPQEIIVISKDSGKTSPISTVAPLSIPNIISSSPKHQAEPEEQEEPKDNEQVLESPKALVESPLAESKVEVETEEEPADLPRKVKAVFSFEGEGNELSFEKGQTIMLLKSMNDGWYLGELDGVEGIFPANYVKDISSAPKEPPKPQTPKPAQVVPKPSASKTITLDFDDAAPRELSPCGEDQQPSSPTLLSPTSSEPQPKQQSTTRAFSYIPQMPPNGFAGLRKANTSNASKELLASQEPVVESVGACNECGCADYTENVFKRGSCNNCFHAH